MGNTSLNTVVKIADQLQGKVVSAVKTNGSTVQPGGNLQKGVYVVQMIQSIKATFTQK